MFVIVSAAQEPQHLAHLGDMDGEHPDSQVTDYTPEDDHCEHRKENPERIQIRIFYPFWVAGPKPPSPLILTARGMILIPKQEIFSSIDASLL